MNIKNLKIDTAAKTSEDCPMDMSGTPSEVCAAEYPSYDIKDTCFIHKDVAYHSKGMEMKDGEKRFNVDPKELRIGEVIGRGASSCVRKAVHVPTGTAIALKTINICDRGRRHQLTKEVRALYDANCSNMIRFFGAFYHEGTISIALEYMDGGSLANVIHQLGRVPEPALANITFQILWGLAYLKSQSRVHRDLKPSNLLINSQGEVKLSDFGLSSELQNSVAMCATFVGTFKYMSPERILNKPYSYASDIWALGVLLIECATGEFPYDGGRSYIEMVQTILESDAPTLPSRRGDFSADFRQLVAQCVRKNPGDRLPADILLGSPWLRKNGAVDIKSAVRNVQSWIESLRSRKRKSQSSK